MMKMINTADIVYDAILEQRKLYEASKNRRSKYFLDLDYVSCSSYGRPRSKNFHFQHFKKLLKDLELPDVRWHDLRGTCATILLLNGMIPKAIAENLGHASEIVTIDDYIDKSKLSVVKLDRLDSFIAAVVPMDNNDKVTNDFSMNTPDIGKYIMG